MTDKIDMSLDDIIKANRSAFRTDRGRGGFRGRRGGRGVGKAGLRGGRASGLPRKFGGGFSSGAGRKFSPRGSAGSKGGAPSSAERWQHDKFQYRGAVGVVTNGVGSQGSSKLTISNLDYGVSDADIKELFNEFGPLKKAAVHYDRSGRSLGTADVIFERRSDALRAMKQYNDVPLDGRPMKIELVGDKPILPVAGGRVLAGRIGKKPPRLPTIGRGPQNNRGLKRPVRGAMRGGRLRRSPKKTPTKEELDAELDAYVSKMDTA